MLNIYCNQWKDMKRVVTLNKDVTFWLAPASYEGQSVTFPPDKSSEEKLWISVIIWYACVVKCQWSAHLILKFCILWCFIEITNPACQNDHSVTVVRLIPNSVSEPPCVRRSPEDVAEEQGCVISEGPVVVEWVDGGGQWLQDAVHDTGD